MPEQRERPGSSRILGATYNNARRASRLPRATPFFHVSSEKLLNLRVTPRRTASPTRHGPHQVTND